MKLDDISKVIKDTRIGDTGYALLLDADRKVIATGMKGQPSDAVQDMSGHPALKIDGISDALRPSTGARTASAWSPMCTSCRRAGP
ncbi:cache domain-containing protein [Massilia sp. B-10]|nr:cache domain-containing protein [Massilia sp. B-10]